MEVSLAASNAETLSLSPASLTFTPENWNVPQDITLNVDFEKVVTAPAIESIQATATTGGSYKDVKSDKVSLKLLKVPEIQNFAYTGAVQSVDLPAGKYKLEVWGAQGGTTGSGIGGKGGYTTGIISLSKNTTLFIAAGQQGSTHGDVTNLHGFNGGGYGTGGGGDGGGATHIAYITGELSSLEASKSSVILVAGGGGGGSTYSSSAGGYGGGISGGNGTAAQFGYGGTQTEGGKGFNIPSIGISGAFGLGGTSSKGNWSSGGGGGAGYYGGGSAGNGPGGGGSGYVSSSLSNAQTIAGNASMPATAGSTETGHTGNGYARITLVE